MSTLSNKRHRGDTAYIVIDLEASGIDPTEARIFELASAGKSGEYEFQGECGRDNIHPYQLLHFLTLYRQN